MVARRGNRHCLLTATGCFHGMFEGTWRVDDAERPSELA